MFFIVFSPLNEVKNQNKNWALFLCHGKQSLSLGKIANAPPWDN
jgi:hypothetical protein